MNLPNYFLADLPPEAELSAVMLAEACQTLKRNRLAYLAGRSTRNLVALLSHLGAEWLDQDYPFRKLALEQGPEVLGFSRETIAAGLDSFFKELTVENLERLIEQDLGHKDRLEQLVSTPLELLAGRASFARSPEFLVHITAGNIPSPALHSMVLGLLLGAAQFIKCGRGASLLPRLFAHSIYHAEPKLGACLELAEWPGGRVDLENTVFSSADCITATGSDQALERIRARVPSPPGSLDTGTGSASLLPARVCSTARERAKRRNPSRKTLPHGISSAVSHRTSSTFKPVAWLPLSCWASMSARTRPAGGSPTQTHPAG